MAERIALAAPSGPGPSPSAYTKKPTAGEATPTPAGAGLPASVAGASPAAGAGCRRPATRAAAPGAHAQTEIAVATSISPRPWRVSRSLSCGRSRLRLPRATTSAACVGDRSCASLVLVVVVVARPDLAPPRPARHAGKVEDATDPVDAATASPATGWVPHRSRGRRPCRAVEHSASRAARPSRGPDRRRSAETIAARSAALSPGVIGVRSLAGLRHDRVDDPEVDLVVSGHAHRGGRRARLVARAPQDRGAALRG